MKPAIFLDAVRAALAVPQEHDKTTTVTAALRADGLCALDPADGATNGDRFRIDITHTLAPVLRPGDTGILDTVFHQPAYALCQAA